MFCGILLLCSFHVCFFKLRKWKLLESSNLFDPSPSDFWPPFALRIHAGWLLHSAWPYAAGGHGGWWVMDKDSDMQETTHVGAGCWCFGYNPTTDYGPTNWNLFPLLVQIFLDSVYENIFEILKINCAILFRLNFNQHGSTELGKAYGASKTCRCKWTRAAKKAKGYPKLCGEGYEFQGLWFGGDGCPKSSNAWERRSLPWKP